MRSSLLCLALFLSAFVAAQESDIIPGEYLVLLRNDLSDNDLAQYVQYVKGNFTLAADPRNEVVEIHQIGETFKAVFMRMTEEMANKQRADPYVVVVEPNRYFHASQSCQIQEDVIWNLARIDERAIDLVDAEYTYSTDGTNVDVYVVDTGILLTHVEFEGRAIWGTNTVDSNNVDCNGHGTHVAGTIGGKLYGVAKNARLIAVKVLDCSGSGTTNGVINGVKWVGTAAKSTGKRSVANMSLGGGFSSTLNSAVNSVVDQGVTFVVAAGNENADACNTSPASASKAITVGATTLVSNSEYKQEDRRASFSNFGSCVSIFAPGQLIKAAWINRSGHPANQAVNTISGTSMASPHTAGVAALLLSNSALSPDQVKQALIDNATKGILDLACPTSGTCKNSPNVFLYTAPCH